MKSLQKISTNIGLHDFQLEKTRCRFHVFPPPATSPTAVENSPTRNKTEASTNINNTSESLLTNRNFHDSPNFSWKPFMRQIFSDSTYQYFGVIFIKLGLSIVKRKINKQLIPSKILIRYHHQPQLWLPPWSLTAAFTPEKLLAPNWKVHLPTTIVPGLYILNFMVCILFCSLPTRQKNSKNQTQTFFFRKVELQNRLLPGENEGLEPKDQPETETEEFTEKKTRHFGLHKMLLFKR